MSILPDENMEYELGLHEINTIYLVFGNDEELKFWIKFFKKDIEGGKRLILINRNTGERIIVDKNYFNKK